MANTHQSNQTPDIIKNLIIVGGEKGGVGKSFFTRYLLAHIINKKGEKSIVCYDADPSVDDVHQIFAEKDWMQKAYLSEDKYKIEESYRIFETKKPTVIVNLPSNIAKNFNNFCEENGLFNEQTQKEVYETCYYFFVSDGSYQSIKLLTEHLDRYEKKKFIKTILILNAGQNGNSSDFSYLSETSNSKTLELLNLQVQENKIPVIIFPELAPVLRFDIDCLLSDEKIKFDQLIKERQHLTTMRRMNFQGYLKNINELFDKIIQWKHNPNTHQGENEIVSIQYDKLANKQKTQREKGNLFSEAS